MNGWTAAALGAVGYLMTGGGSAVLLPLFWRMAIRELPKASRQSQAADVRFAVWSTLLLWPIVLTVGGSIVAVGRLVDLYDPRRPNRAERRRAELNDRIARLEQENGL